jgi:trans-aconitate 2-methyltransferase
MIAAAKRSKTDADWVLGDIRTWRSETAVDLVFSNAALQWVSNHREIFPRLLRQVAAGGAFAVQMPANTDSRAYRCLRHIAESPSWASQWPIDMATIDAAAPEVYYDLLAPSCQRLEIWVTEYDHVLPDRPAIVEWMKGTGLRPYLEALRAPSEREAFLDELTRCVADAYPLRSDGRVLFPFRRLFLVAST